MLTVKNGSIQPGSFHLLGIDPETQYGGLTVGFSGSGGAGKIPSPTQTFAGSLRIP